MSELKELLKNARLKKGLRQRDVARQLGYGSSQFISNWERGLSVPPFEKLKKLAQIYGLSKETLRRFFMKNYNEKLKKHLYAQND